MLNILTALLLPLFSFAELPAPDCHYSGTGTLYALDHATNGFVPIPEKGYVVEVVRYPMGGGKFFFEQKKTFADNRPAQSSTFSRRAFVGSFDNSTPDGSVINHGFCSRPGHCFGTMKTRTPAYEGKFTVDYDSTSMRSVNTPANGEFFMDELLTASGNCPF